MIIKLVKNMNKEYCPQCKKEVNTYMNTAIEHYEICCSECDDILSED